MSFHWSGESRRAAGCGEAVGGWPLLFMSHLIFFSLDFTVTFELCIWLLSSSQHRSETSEQTGADDWNWCN